MLMHWCDWRMWVRQQSGTFRINQKSKINVPVLFPFLIPNVPALLPPKKLMVRKWFLFLNKKNPHDLGGFNLISPRFIRYWQKFSSLLLGHTFHHSMGNQDIFVDLDYVKGDHAISEQSPCISLFVYPLPSSRSPISFHMGLMPLLLLGISGINKITQIIFNGWELTGLG